MSVLNRKLWGIWVWCVLLDREASLADWFNVQI